MQHTDEIEKELNKSLSLTKETLIKTQNKCYDYRSYKISKSLSLEEMQIHVNTVEDILKNDIYSLYNTIDKQIKKLDDKFMKMTKLYQHMGDRDIIPHFYTNKYKDKGKTL